MFANIVGDIALTVGDMAHAIEMLCRNREILRPAIDKYKGEYLEKTGYKLPENFHTVLTFQILKKYKTNSKNENATQSIITTMRQLQL